MFLSPHRVDSAEGVPDPPQIRAGLWHSVGRIADGRLSSTLESPQGVGTGRALLHNSAKVEACDWQNGFIGDYSFNKYEYFL